MPGTALQNLGLLAGWADGENGWGADMNANLRRLDCLIQGRIADRDLTAAPGSPAAGDTYIVAAAPTGTWTGHATHIARYSGSAWEYFTPKAGWEMWVVDENSKVRFNGTAWVVI